MPEDQCRGIPRFREDAGKNRHRSLEEVGRLVVAMEISATRHAVRRVLQQ